MRLFIATDLPRPVIASVLDVRKRLSGDYMSVRWVRDESLHVTLKFLGPVPESRVGAIEESLAAIRKPPFRVEVTGVGFFPNPRAPRVFWAGVVSDELAELAGVVDDRMAELGFSAESREFRPHLTLARSRGNSRMDAALVDRARPLRGHEFGRFQSDRFCLYASRLEASGAVHTRLRAYVLGGSTTGE